MPHYGPLVIPCDSSASDSSTVNSSTLTSQTAFPNNHPSFQQQRNESRSPSPYFDFRSPPSPTPSSVSSQRHTSRVIIKSDPPAPPKRHNSTTLSRHGNSQSTCCLSSSCGCHSSNSKHCSTLIRSTHCSDCSGNHCRQYRHRRHHCHRTHRHSPPSSPSSSSGVSCGSNPPLNSTLSRRCKSFDELSHSSNEDSSSILWEEGRYQEEPAIPTRSKAPVIPPPPPQNFPLAKSISTSHINKSGTMATSTDTAKTNLASALSSALQQRNLSVSSLIFLIIDNI